LRASDRALLELWATRRDAEAFAEIVKRYAGMVYGTCRRVLGDATEAEDVAQECFAKLSQIDPVPRQSLGGWLHRVATNRSLNRLKADYRRHEREKEYSAMASNAGETSWQDLQGYVDKAIAELPDELRLPVIVHFLEGKTHRAVAKSLGISRSAVTRRIQHGVELIRKNLKRRGISTTAVSLAALMSANLTEAAPPSLIAALGKLALAGNSSAVTSAGGTGMTALAVSRGILAMKKTAVGVAVIAAAVVSLLAVTQRQQSAPVQTAVETAVATQEDPAAEDEFEWESIEPLLEETVQSQASVPESIPEVVPPSEGGVIAGRIYDADTGQGIGGVRIVVSPENGRGRGGKSGTSDEVGFYRVTNLSDGTYRVSPRPPAGYPEMGSYKPMTVTVEEDEPAEGVDFAYDKGIRIAGTVVFADGEPVAGARVSATTENMPGAEHADSEVDGSFEVFLLRPEDTLILQARTDDFESEMLGPMMLPGQGLDGLVLKLTEPRASSISGTVVDSARTPMAGVSVHLDREKADYLVGGARAKSADDGSFTIERLAAGEYGIILTPPGIEMWSSANELMRVELSRGEARTGLTIVFGDRGGLAIEGRVIDTSGNPIAKAHVHYFGPTQGSGYSGEDGSYRITGLADDIYKLSALHQDYSSSGTRLIRAGSENIEIVLQGRASVEGRVVRADTGEPVREFELFLLIGGATKVTPRLFMNRQSVRDPEGRFSRTVPAGTVTLTARAPGLAPSFQVLSLAEHETETDIELYLEPSEQLEGKVVNGAGEPVSDAWIFLDSIPPQESYDITKTRSVARTASDGSFSIDSLPPETELIVAAHRGYAPGATPVSEHIVIVLPSAGTLEGTITRGGMPLPDADVHIHPDDRYLPYMHFVTTDDGAYRFEGLAPGTVRLSANTRGRFSLSKDAVIESGQTTAVDLDFSPGSSVVEGYITVEGEPVQRAAIQLWVSGEPEEVTCRGRVDLEGFYRFRDVPAGWARVMAQVADETTEDIGYNWPRTRFVEFEIGDRETVRQDIDFFGQSSIMGQVLGLDEGLSSTVLVFHGEVAIPAQFDSEVYLGLISHMVRQTECTENGSFEVSRLEPGTYTVLATAMPVGSRDFSQMLFASTLVEIQSAESVRAEFNFGP